MTSRSWLNRTIVGIGLASLFSDVGHEMATAGEAPGAASCRSRGRPIAGVTPSVLK